MEPTLTESLNDDSQLVDEDTDFLDTNIIHNKLNDEAESSNEDRDLSTLLEGKMLTILQTKNLSFHTCYGLAKRLNFQTFG